MVFISLAQYNQTQKNFVNGPIMGFSTTFISIAWDGEREVPD